MKLAFLYAGQGSQHAGMGKDLYQLPEFAAVLDSVQLDFDLKTLCFEGPEETLAQTRYTQPCMVAFACGVTALLAAEGIRPDAAAGLSLGEYSALACAGVFTPSQAISLAAFRGDAMAKAVQGRPCGMTAVLGLDREKLAACCAEVADKGVCEIANYNCPGQIVISGQKAAVEAATEKLKERGARRVIPLAVSGAFHTSLLQEASQKLEQVLQTYTFASPGVPVIANVSGVQETRDLKEVLKEQICHSVQFTQSIETMLAMGIDTFIEIGPGHSLSGFVRKTSRDVKTYSIDTVADMEKVLQEVHAHEC